MTLKHRNLNKLIVFYSVHVHEATLFIRDIFLSITELRCQHEQKHIPYKQAMKTINMNQADVHHMTTKLTDTNRGCALLWLA